MCELLNIIIYCKILKMLLFLFVLTKNDLNVKTDKLEVKKNEEKNEIRCI